MMFDIVSFMDSAHKLPCSKWFSSEVYDAVVEEVSLEALYGKIPCYDPDKHLFGVALRRVEDRSKCLYGRGHLHLSILDEDLNLCRGTVSIDSLDKFDVPDWDSYFSCLSFDCDPDEGPEFSVDSVAGAVADMSSQQRRHYNAVCKDILPFVNDDIKSVISAADVKARDIQRVRHNEKRRKGTDVSSCLSNV